MRKTQMLSWAALLVFLSSAAAAQEPALRDRDRVAANPVPPHSFIFPYHSQEAALTFDLTQSTYYHSLNGNWKFRWYAHRDEIKPDVFRAGYAYKNWDDIAVPANWQVAGLREGRRYDNPSPGANAPSSRPAGVYQTTFGIPPGWQGRKVFLHLTGISGQAAVWLNGRLLGHHENDFLPVEFDLTGLVQAEKNALVVAVTSRTPAKTTHWRLSGIDRDVFLFSTPLFHVMHFNVGSYYHGTYASWEKYEEAAERMRDYYFHYNESYTNYTGKTLPLLGYRMVSAVLKEDGQKAGPIEEGDSIKVNSQRFEKGRRIDTVPHLKPNERFIGHTLCCFPQDGLVHPSKLWRKWSTEIPYLYRKVYEVRDEQYRLTEALSFKLGIRDVRVANEALRINGKPVKLKGVHYTAFDPDNGLAVSEEIMLRDVKLMKRHNINAVWLSHPHPTRWYELCNAYGLYVIDQYADLAGDSASAPGNGEVARGPYALPERDGSFTSVVAWSWTTGARWQKGLDSLYLFIKQKEGGTLPRPVVYLASGSEAVPLKGNFQMIGLPSVSAILSHLQKDKSRSLLLSHYRPGAGGDSLGSLKNAVQAMNQYPGFGGIFLRQWTDQAVRIPGKSGQTEWLSNGTPPDGLVGADGTPKDYLLEVKKAFQSVRFATVDLAAWKVRLYNEYHFLNLDFGELHWQLEAGGIPLQEGTAGDLSILPRRSKDFLLPIAPFRQEPGKQYALRLGVRLKEDCPWAEKGFEVAWERFSLFK